MTFRPPQDKPSAPNPQAAGSSPAGSAPPTPVSVRARGLADFVDNLLSGSRLDRAGIPTKAESTALSAPPVEEEPPELLDLLLECPDAIVVIHREQGEIIEVSERFIEWTGLSRQDLAGRPFLELFSDVERKIARTLYEDAGAGGVHVLAPDGTRLGTLWTGVATGNVHVTPSVLFVTANDTVYRIPLGARVH